MASGSGGTIAGRWTVAIGTPANPTPIGRFALSEIVKQPRASGFFGTYIITLTAHSENPSEFDGGDGRVALHGTNQPQLLGQAVSHGCERLSNPVATRIAKTAPAGAPVEHPELTPARRVRAGSRPAGPRGRRRRRRR